ncbi:MAG: GTPase HflX [Rhodospirillales bacterium]|nr:GTPase HflX [Rhodospirillales bacterium]
MRARIRTRARTRTRTWKRPPTPNTFDHDELSARPVAGRALVVHPALRTGAGRAPARESEARLAEAVGLAEAINLDILHREVVPAARPRPATLFGSGTVERLGGIVAADDIEVAVVDAGLSPIQQRNLERAWKCKVIDRTGLILEIFGARAQTREGRLQVELAALTYQRSRLVRSWTHLERQRGGFGFVGGPGETQIEADRRLIDERITRLKKDLAEVRRTRELHRAARRRVPFPIVALVGYTNAGKSTLFNRLTEADVDQRDQLFATLDPTMRRLNLPSGETAILSDTVGFISDLPHELVEAFQATLEEVKEADILMHVRDAAHADSEAQKEDVLDVLKGLGMDGEDSENGNRANGAAPMIEVFNKSDILLSDRAEELRNRARRANQRIVLISAKTGAGIEMLLGAVDNLLAAGRVEVRLNIPWSDGAELAWLYDHGEVLERKDGAEFVALRVRLSETDAKRVRHLAEPE